MSNNYASCFNRTDFVVIPSHIELPCSISFQEKKSSCSKFVTHRDFYLTKKGMHYKRFLASLGTFDDYYFQDHLREAATVFAYSGKT